MHGASIAPAASAGIYAFRQDASSTLFESEAQASFEIFFDEIRNAGIDFSEKHFNRHGRAIAHFQPDHHRYTAWQMPR